MNTGKKRSDRDYFKPFRNLGESLGEIREEVIVYFDKAVRQGWETVVKIEERYFERHKGKNWREKLNFSLSLSGGGIRSAAFSIGIIQALQNKNERKNNLLENMSYMSTVSGGGFAGASLTWFLLNYQTFPFGHKISFEGSQEFESKNQKSNEEKEESEDEIRGGQFNTNLQAKDKELIKKQKKKIQEERNDRANKILSYIRQHGNYLIPYQLGKASFVARGALSVFHSALAYLLFFSAIFFTLIFLTDFIDFKETDFSGLVVFGFNFFETYLAFITNFLEVLLGKENIQDFQVDYTGALGLVALANVGLFFGLIIIFGLLTAFAVKETPLGYQIRVFNQWVLGRLLILFLISLVLAALPVGYELLVGTGKGGGSALRVGLFLSPTILGAILAIYKFQKDLGGESTQNRYFFVFATIVVVALIFSVLTLSFSLASQIYLIEDPRMKWGLAAFAFVFPLIVDINLISLHRVYRDRLAETFMWDPDTGFSENPHVKGNKASKAILSSFVFPNKNSDDNKEKPWVPYHLINTNVVFTNPRHPKLRGRHGDSFLLSPFYCGSQSTGYSETTTFLGDRMTLATAVATSGAAVNPNAGVSGSGLTINPLFSFLMTFFGLRLGLWVRNPSLYFLKIHQKLPPNYFSPGFKSLLGFGQKEDSDRLELTDGGHFDNTGLYELFRRRAPNIILCDGAADSNFTFDDLGNALERARVDFGVKVSFEKFIINKKRKKGEKERFSKEYKLGSLLPGSRDIGSKTGTPKAVQEKLNLAERGFAMAEITYPETENGQKTKYGRLFYFKATLVDDLPADIYAYRVKNPNFPSQSTVDQFFDERQFESYRELGYRLAKPHFKTIVKYAVSGKQK